MYSYTVGGKSLAYSVREGITYVYITCNARSVLFLHAAASAIARFSSLSQQQLRLECTECSPPIRSLAAPHLHTDIQYLDQGYGERERGQDARAARREKERESRAYIRAP